MNNLILRACPFCGEIPSVCGREIKEYMDGQWAEGSRKEYWIQPRCKPWCPYGNVHASKYGIVGGAQFVSEEAAANYWNRRFHDEME